MTDNTVSACPYCFEKIENCVCTWTKCHECGKRIPESHASEYRGRVWCEDAHDFDEQVAKRDFQRSEVMAEMELSTRSQLDGQWANGGYKTMKTDPHTGRPMGEVKESARLKIYEGRTI